MDSLELNQEVRIKAIGTNGHVIGIWHSAFGQTQYNIRYYDTTNHRADNWFVKDELEGVG